MSNMVINTNVLALNAHRSMKNVGEMQSKASQKLSSGLRINSAADDAAGLAISEKMRAQIRGLNQASKNAQDAISLIQTAEGGMQEIDNMLQRIRELTVQASNDTNEHNELGTGDRQKMQDEVNQLISEIDSMAERVEFNKKKVINGDYANPQEILDSRNKQLQAVTDEQAATAIRSATTNGDLIDARVALDLFSTPTNLYNVYVGAKAQYNLDRAGMYDEYRLLLADPAYGATLAEAQTTGGVAAYAGHTPEELYAWLSPIASGLVVNAAVPVDFLAAGGLWDTSNTALKTARDNWKNASTGQFGVYLQAKDNFQLSDAAFNAGFTTIKGDPFYQPMLDDINAAGGGIYMGSTATALYDYLVANYSYLTDVDQIATADAFLALGDQRVFDAEVLQTAGDIWQKDTAGQEQLKTLQLAVKTAEQAKSAADKQATLIKKRYDVAAQLQTEATDAVVAAGGFSQQLYFQVGANANQGLEMNIGSIKSSTLGLGDGLGNTTIDLLRSTGAEITGILDTLDTALSYVSTERSKLGAAQNRLEYTIRSLDISSENLSASESRIRDADMAKEMMNLTKANVLQQAATSMLAQANQAPQNILQLLR